MISLIYIVRDYICEHVSLDCVPALVHLSVETEKELTFLRAVLAHLFHHPGIGLILKFINGKTQSDPK